MSEQRTRKPPRPITLEDEILTDCDLTIRERGGWVELTARNCDSDESVCIVRKDARRLRDWLSKWLEGKP